MRPASFQAWFEPLVLIDAEEADTLHLWAPSAAHAEWIQECYHQLLTKACQGVGYGNYRLIVGPDRKEVDQSCRTYPTLDAGKSPRQSGIYLTKLKGR